jgi:hypothetical protein
MIDVERFELSDYGASGAMPLICGVGAATECREWGKRRVGA